MSCFGYCKTTRVYVITTYRQVARKTSELGSFLHVKRNKSGLQHSGVILNVFLFSYLLPDKGRSSKQKTPVVRRTCNPAWNHTFVYSDVSLQELSERALELTVWDHDRLASNEFLGGLRFSLGNGKTSLALFFICAASWAKSTG